MKVCIASDLHLDSYSKEEGEAIINQINEIECDLFLYAGDAGNGVYWIHHLQKEVRHKQAAYCLGNHDFYGGEVFDDSMLCTIKGVRIAATCLWTNFNSNPISQMMAFNGIPDFKRIEKFTTQNCIELFNKQKQFLRNNKADIVITHFPPSQRILSPKYEGSLLNNYFLNSQEELMLEIDAKLWVSGHTHLPFGAKIGNTLLVGNPKGYRHEGFNEWKPLIIEL